MVTRLLLTGLVLIGLAAPATADTGNLQLFRSVQREVLRYPFFTIFDSVQAQVDDGVVVLTGKVTMPFKRNALEQRVARVDGIVRVDNRIDVLPVSQFDNALRCVFAPIDRPSGARWCRWRRRSRRMPRPRPTRSR